MPEHRLALSLRFAEILFEPSQLFRVSGVIRVQGDKVPASCAERVPDSIFRAMYINTTLERMEVLVVPSTV
jgi:hypothetical protein